MKCLQYATALTGEFAFPEATKITISTSQPSTLAFPFEMDLGGDCNCQGHGPYCSDDRCSGHDEHKMMYVEDIVDAILTPTDSAEILRLIAYPSSPAAREGMRTARRSRIVQKITEILSAQKRELLAGLLAANHGDSECSIVYNEVIATGCNRERERRIIERRLDDIE